MQKKNTQVDNLINLGVSIYVSFEEQLSQRLAEREQLAGTPGTSDSFLPTAALNELKQFTFAL